MPLTYANAVLAGSIGSLVAMVALLVGKRLRRDRAERIQAQQIEILGAMVHEQDLDHGAIAALRRVAGARPIELARMERVLRHLEPARLALLREVLPDDLRVRLSRRLSREVRSGDAVCRATGALLIARLALPNAAGRIAPMLDDRDPDVAQAACRALGVLGTDAGARALIVALSHESLPTERVIESLLSPTSSPALVAALGDPAFRPVHHHIVRALGLIGSPEAEEALLAAGAVADDEVQVAICRALVTAGTDRSIDHLLLMLDHEAWPVRAQAASALGERTATHEVVDRLEAALSDPAWWVRANAANALAALGGVGIAGLIRATRHADRYARARAEETLALIAIEGASL